MKFATSVATFLTLISSALAQTAGFDAITSPTKDETVSAGSTYAVTWDYSSKYAGTVTITLLEGSSSTTLELGDAVATSVDNSAGSYSWTVASDLGAKATYGLKISLDSDPTIFQYSFPFKIAASSSSSNSESSSEESSSAAASASPKSSSSSSSAGASATAPVSPTSSSEPTTSGAAGTGSSGSGSDSDSSNNSSATGAKTTLSSVVGATSTGSGSAASSTTSVTAGAGKVVAGTFAAMGGMAAALVAL